MKHFISGVLCGHSFAQAAFVGAALTEGKLVVAASAAVLVVFTGVAFLGAFRELA